LKEKKRRKPIIPQIKRILYATDLSDNSAFVFRYAINFAKKHDAGIVILNVLDPLSVTAKALTHSHLTVEQEKKMLEEKLAYAKERIRKGLKTFYEKELKNDPDSTDRVESVELCEGFPAEVILSKADELNCDAIIMGTHGKGILANTFLGSTSKRVLRRTRKPVFIIPLPKGKIDIVSHDD
jgi:nucleotide-binding universal stress UspA family protein